MVTFLSLLLLRIVQSSIYSNPQTDVCTDKKEGCGCEKLQRSASKPDSTANRNTLNRNEEGHLGADNMVLISAGDFFMGTDKQFLPLDGEGPSRKVFLDEFYIDKFEVTNSQFKAFVDSTNHKTDAEVYGDSFVLDGTNYYSLYLSLCIFML